MNRFGIALKAARDYRGAALSVVLVMALIAFFIISLYPSYRDSLADFEIPDAMAGLLGEAGSLTTPEGFISAEFFSWVPIMLIVLAIFAGTGTTAGEEAAGTLELLLAQPTSRRRILLEKVGGLATLLALAALLSFPGFVVAKLIWEFDVSNGRILQAVLTMIPVTWLFLCLAVAAGVIFPSRGTALGAVVGVLVSAYLIYSVGAAVDALSAVRKLTPFYWSDASHVLIHGTNWLRHLGFIVVSAALLVVAVLAFERRDVAASQGGLLAWFRPREKSTSAAETGASRRAAHESD